MRKAPKVAPGLVTTDKDTVRLHIDNRTSKKGKRCGRGSVIRNTDTRGNVIRNTDTIVEEDGAADPLFDLGPAPKHKHLSLMYYFLKLANNPNTKANLTYIDELIAGGADVNAKDRAGQTLLHEVARDWGPDIASYLIDKGAKVDERDDMGRTPLHIACRTENTAVARTLLERDADVGAVTRGELQTPLHYAARHDAAQVIGVLAREFESGVDPRDYKGRTPLLLAAELDRSVAALALLEVGAKAGIIDKTGLHTLCAMVEKMPGVAQRALNQFHVTNRASRQQFFFLNYMEPDPDIDQADFLPLSVLGTIVSSRELRLMHHPVIKEMIRVKWSRFAQSKCLLNLLIYGMYLACWTVVVFLYRPWRDGDKGGNIANIVSVSVAVLLSLYLFLEEIRDLYKSESSHRRFILWRAHQIERDLEYVPDKLTEERDYLLSQAQEVRDSPSEYARDPWNWLDWLTYVLMLVTSVCVVTCLAASPSSGAWYWTFALWTSRFMCGTLLLIWVKLFKYVRVYSFLGPFVVILVNTVADISKIVFVFCVFYVPTVATFYQFYYKKDDPYFGGVRETIFTVYRMLLVDDYGYDDIRNTTYEVENDKGETVTVGAQTWWTDCVVFTWLLVGAIVILNLFIALMSDTFQRVYDNALAVSLLERATIIVSIEGNLPANRRRAFLRYLKDKCAPLERYYDDDITEDDDEQSEVKKFSQQTLEAMVGLDGKFRAWKQDNRTDISEIAAQMTAQNDQIKRLEKAVRDLAKAVRPQGTALGPIRNILK